MRTVASSYTDSEPIYDTHGVAVRLGVHHKTVQRWVREGKLACSQVAPRTRRFTEAHIKAFLSTMTTDPSFRPRKRRAA